MIIVRIYGGLGNQMFQYAFARSLAKKNNDVFKLDIGFFPKQKLRKYELNKFRIIEQIATSKEINELKGREGYVYKILKKLGLQLNKPQSYFSEAEVTNIDERIFGIRGDVYLDGYWQNEFYFKNIKEEIMSDFIPRIACDNETENWLRQIESTNSISIHVRRGDYVKNSRVNGAHGICGLDYYRNAVDYMYKKIIKPVFYIFSDDIAWCKIQFDFLSNKFFVDNTKGAIDDLTLMSHCKHNIIANSTFSWWGAWLNSHNDKIVICPSVWWKSKPELHIAPGEWVKL